MYRRIRKRFLCNMYGTFTCISFPVFLIYIYTGAFLPYGSTVVSTYLLYAGSCGVHTLLDPPPPLLRITPEQKPFLWIERAQLGVVSKKKMYELSDSSFVLHCRFLTPNSLSAILHACSPHIVRLQGNSLSWIPC